MMAASNSSAKGGMIPADVTGELSLGSVVRAMFVILGIAAAVLLVVLLQHVIVLLLLGLFLSAIIDPGVRKLRSWGIQESLGILLHYILFLSVAVFLVFSFIPIIAQQLGDIAKLADSTVTQLLTERIVSLPLVPAEIDVRLTILLRMLLRNLALNGPDALEHFSLYLSEMAAGSVQLLTGIAGSVLYFIRDSIIVLLSAFFIELDRNHSYRWARRFFPASMWPYMDARVDLINQKLGQWMRGQLLLCLAIGVLTFIVLVVLGMPYALTLAILAGFTEFIPYIGPLIGAIPAVMIALGSGGPSWALMVAGAYYVIQFCENNFIVPLIMKHAVDLPATTIIIAMLVGISFPAVIHPVLGILIAIPLASIVGIFLEDLRTWSRERWQAR